MTNSNVSSLMPSLRARQDVAAAVRAHMAVRGVKDAEVARDLGWSQSYMSRRTNAGTSFSVDDLGVLALHFDLSIVDLVQMPTGRPIGGGTTFAGGGLRKGRLKLVELPEVDSNHQPAGSLLRLVLSVPEETTQSELDRLETVEHLGDLLPFPARPVQIGA